MKYGCSIALAFFSFLFCIIGFASGVSNIGFLCLSIGIVCVFILMHISKSDQEKLDRQNEEIREKKAWIQSTEGFQEDGFLGEYIAGFDTTEKSNFRLGYFTTTDKFVFYSYGDFEKVYEIPRDSIVNYDILDHSQFTKRFTLSALFFMGPYGISQQETDKHEIYYLRFECVREDSTKMNIIIRYTNTGTFQKFISLSKPFRSRLSSEDKKCPYCAETIKRQAIKCRFCGTDLTQTQS